MGKQGRSDCSSGALGSTFVVSRVYLMPLPATVAQSVECPLRGTAGQGFDPEPQHFKVVKIVLAAPCLALRLIG